MQNHHDKRKYRRIDAHGRLSYRPVNGVQAHPAYCRNISGNGLLFHGPIAVTVGHALEITLSPDNHPTPPLDAFVEVTRCEPHDDGFEIAAIITGIKGS